MVKEDVNFKKLPCFYPGLLLLKLQCRPLLRQVWSGDNLGDTTGGVKALS